jgi:hypothetical protein
MVGVAGFEPATPASRTQCSTRLSHTPTWRAAYRHASALSQATKNPPQKEKRREKRSSKQRCIRPTPALSPPPRRAPRGFAVPAGEWCNGNTAVFGTVVLGSSPSSPATSSTSRTSAQAAPSGARRRGCLSLADRDGIRRSLDCRVAAFRPAVWLERRGFPQKLAECLKVEISTRPTAGARYGQSRPDEVVQVCMRRSWGFENPGTPCGDAA